MGIDAGTEYVFIGFWQSGENRKMALLAIFRGFQRLKVVRNGEIGTNLGGGVV